MNIEIREKRKKLISFFQNQNENAEKRKNVQEIENFGDSEFNKTGNICEFIHFLYQANNISKIEKVVKSIQLKYFKSMVGNLKDLSLVGNQETKNQLDKNEEIQITLERIDHISPLVILKSLGKWALDYSMNLDSEILVKVKELNFVQKYYQLLNFLEKKNLIEAKKMIVSILSFYCPLEFIFVVILHSFQILSKQFSIFTSKDLMVLLNAFTLFHSSYSSSHSVDGDELEDIKKRLILQSIDIKKEKLDFIRYSLLRYYSQALLSEV